MQVNKCDNQTNFGAIFNLKKTPDKISQIVIDAVAESTVPAEAEKIAKKFQIGGGSLYVYVPDENMQKLFNKLKYVNQEATITHLTRVD